METGDIIYYNKYVMDILIIFHHKKLARTKFMHTWIQPTDNLRLNQHKKKMDELTSTNI